jgi:hypothetical protein
MPSKCMWNECKQFYNMICNMSRLEKLKYVAKITPEGLGKKMRSSCYAAGSSASSASASVVSSSATCSTMDSSRYSR